MLLIMPLPAMQLLSLLYAGTCLAFGMECGLRNDMFYKGVFTMHFVFCIFFLRVCVFSVAKVSFGICHRLFKSLL